MESWRNARCKSDYYILTTWQEPWQSGRHTLRFGIIRLDEVSETRMNLSPGPGAKQFAEVFYTALAADPQAGTPGHPLSQILGKAKAAIVEAARTVPWTGGTQIVVDGSVITLMPVESPPGSPSVAVPTAPLPVWASPKAMALAAWLTAFLTLIAVILAAAALESDQGSSPAHVQIVIMTPGRTSP